MEEIPNPINYPALPLSTDPGFQREQFVRLKVGKYYYLEYYLNIFEKQFHTDCVVQVSEITDKYLDYKIFKKREYKRRAGTEPNAPIVCFAEYKEMLQREQGESDEEFHSRAAAHWNYLPLTMEVCEWEDDDERRGTTNASVNFGVALTDSENPNVLFMNRPPSDAGFASFTRFYIPKLVGGGRKTRRLRRSTRRRVRRTRRRT